VRLFESVLIPSTPTRSFLQPKAVAELEHKIGLVASNLLDVIDNTKRFVEKKQTRTKEEVDADRKEEEEGALPEPEETADGDDSDEEQVIHSSQNSVTCLGDAY
jgi:hypothetical protein